MFKKPPPYFLCSICGGGYKCTWSHTTKEKDFPVPRSKSISCQYPSLQIWTQNMEPCDGAKLSQYFITTSLDFVFFCSVLRDNHAFDSNEHNLTVCENDFQTAEHVLSQLGDSLDALQVSQL